MSVPEFREGYAGVARWDRADAARIECDGEEMSTPVYRMETPVVMTPGAAFLVGLGFTLEQRSR